MALPQRDAARTAFVPRLTLAGVAASHFVMSRYCARWNSSLAVAQLVRACSTIAIARFAIAIGLPQRPLAERRMFGGVLDSRASFSRGSP